MAITLEQQRALATARARQRLAANGAGKPQNEVSTVADVTKSAGSGLVKGLSGLAGLPGDLQAGVDWGVRKVGSLFGLTPGQIPEGVTPGFVNLDPPRSADVLNFVKENVTGDLYEPQTRAGRYADTAGEFLPAAAAGPGTATQRIATALLASAGSEAAGQATEGTAYEPYARVGGALIGGMAPAAVPSRTALPAVPGVNREAASRVATALSDDALTDPAALAARRAELGPNAMLLNAGENTRTHAERLAQMPGAQMRSITEPIQRQVQGSGARVRQGIDDVMGQPIDVEAQMVTNRATRAANAQQAYRRAFEAADPVDTTPVLQFIDDQLQPGIHSVVPGGNVASDSIAGALQRARGLLAGQNGQRVGMDVLHRAQQEIADMADAAARQGRNRQAGLLRDVRSRLMDQMNTATTQDGRSLYREATRQFAGESAVMDALREGQSAFSRPFRAGQLNQMLQRIGPEERASYIQGARDNVAAVMDAAGPTMAGNADSQRAWKTLLSEENMAKMRLLFGPDEADQIRRILSREAGFGADANRVLQNSATSRREAARGLYRNPSEAPSRTALPAWGRAEQIATGVYDRVRGSMQRGKINRTNQEAADILTRPLSDPVVDALMARASAAQQQIPRRAQVADSARRAALIEAIMAPRQLSSP